MNVKENQGFTLIELLVTVSVVVILSIIAMPSWNNLVQSNSVSTSVNQVQSIYQLARSEALKRNESIILTSTNSLHTWTITDSVTSSVLKAMTLSTEHVSVAQGAGNTGEVSITILNTGFAENKKLAFDWGNEYLCLMIFSSGQSETSTESGDCA